MAPPFHRPQLTPEDRRFHGLWTALALVALLAVVWAAHQTVVDTERVVHAIPDRILQLIERPEHRPSPRPSDRARQTASGGQSSRPAEPVAVPTVHGPVALDPSDMDAFQRFFSHPAFGVHDDNLDELARTLDGPQGIDPHDRGLEVDGVVSGADGGHRTDVGVGEIARVERHPVVMVHPRTGPSGSAMARLGSVKSEPKRPELPSRVVDRAVRAWSRHAGICQATHAAGFSGRVALRVWVVDGNLLEVKVDGLSRHDSRRADFVRCLQVRARALLQFSPGHTGEARIPLVFEAR